MVSPAKRPESEALTTIYYYILSCVLKNLTDIILIQMVIKKKFFTDPAMSPLLSIFLGTESMDDVFRRFRVFSFFLL